MTQRQLDKVSEVERSEALKKYLQEAWNEFTWNHYHEYAYEMGDEFIRAAVEIVEKNLKGVK